MKKIIFGFLLAGACSLVNAQVPDSTRRMKSAPQHRTDSVRNGKEIYNGTRTNKSKSNGDTLANPRKNGKTSKETKSSIK